MEDPIGTTSAGGTEQQQQCCLCLLVSEEWDAPSDKFRDVFARGDNSSLATKILTCTGVQLHPADQAICRNCEQTILLIDEFRGFCQQANQMLGGLHVLYREASHWECFRNHVGELRRLVREQRTRMFSIPGRQEGKRIEQLFVKVEPAGEESWDHDDTSDLVAVKDEYGEFALGECDIGGLEPVDEKDPKIATKLEIARQIAAHSSSKLKSKEPPWKEIAKKVKLRAPKAQKLWDEMKQSHKDRRKRCSAAKEKPASDVGVLYTLMDTIFPDVAPREETLGQAEPKEPSSAGPAGKKRKTSMPSSSTQFGAPERLALAKVVYEHEIIWNRSHSRYQDHAARDSVFTEIGAQLNWSLDETKRQWKALRDVFRARYIRILKSGSSADGPQFQDELYLLLEKMLKDNIEFGKHQSKEAAGLQGTTEINEPDKMRLAELVYKRELIWNPKHESYGDQGKREAAFNAIATELNTPIGKVKQRWRGLRDFFRQRRLRLQKGLIPKEHPSLQEPVYLLLTRMLLTTTNNTKRGPAQCVENDLDRLELAQAVYEREVLWNKEHPKYKDSQAQDNAWQQVATQLSVPLADLKRQWKNARDCFRSKQKRVHAKDLDPSQAYRPFDQLMEQIMGRNHEESSGNADEVDDSIRLLVAQKISERELLWNKSHPDFADKLKRDVSWEGLRMELNIPVAQLKQHWRYLRDVFRHRYRRFMEGKIPLDHSSLNDELYPVLERMLMGNIDFVGEWAKPECEPESLPAQTKDKPKPFADPELRARLAEEIRGNAILWDLNRPDYHNSALRGQAWTSIGQALGVESHYAQAEWQRVIHSRTVRSGTIPPELAAGDPLLQLCQYISQNYVAIPGTSSTAASWPPKRRHTGKKAYSNEGCMQVRGSDKVRHMKVCEQCGKHVERSEFEDHMNLHNGLKPYDCAHCCKKFASNTARNRHVTLAHDPEAHRFECDQCGERFRYRSKFDYHYAVNHQSQEIPCQVCGKPQKHRKALLTHMKLHEEQHECQYCDKVFQKKHSLTVHMRSHTQTQENQYLCGLCGLRFQVKELLTTHLSNVHGVLIQEVEAVLVASGGQCYQ